MDTVLKLMLRNLKNEKNKYAGNGDDKVQEKISAEKSIVMQ